MAKFGEDMKERTIDEPVTAEGVGSHDGSTDSESKPENWCYAKELRTLGQMLEAHQLSSIDLEVESGVYFVHGKATVQKSNQSSLSKLIRDFVFGTEDSPEEKSADDIKLRYTQNEIQQLDSEAREKRQDESKTPDPHSLSQVLRGAGSFLDSKQTSLIGITINGRWITLRYRTSEGNLEQAKQDIEYFFNYWVKMYLRRKNRAKLELRSPSDPTLVVTWEGLKRQNPTC